MAKRNPENSVPPINADQLFALAPQLRELLKGVSQIELEHFSMEIGDLDLFIPTSGFSTAPRDPVAAPIAAPVKPSALIRESFTRTTMDFPGRIREVRREVARLETEKTARARR